MPATTSFNRGTGFVSASGLIVPSTSGGIVISSSLSSVSVILSTQTAGRIFVAGSGQAVGSGTTDAQRVGFPIGGSTSGQLFYQSTRINISNPALLSASAETSGGILLIGIETP